MLDVYIFWIAVHLVLFAIVYAGQKIEEKEVDKNE